MSAICDGDGDEWAEGGSCAEVSEEVRADDAGAVADAHAVAKVLEEVVLDHEGAVHPRVGVHRAEFVGREVVGADAVVDELPVGFSEARLVNILAQALRAGPVEGAVGSQRMAVLEEVVVAHQDISARVDGHSIAQAVAKVVVDDAVVELGCGLRVEGRGVGETTQLAVVHPDVLPPAGVDAEGVVVRAGGRAGPLEPEAGEADQVALDAEEVHLALAGADDRPRAFPQERQPAWDAHLRLEHILPGGQEHDRDSFPGGLVAGGLDRRGRPPLHGEPPSQALPLGRGQCYLRADRPPRPEGGRRRLGGREPCGERPDGEQGRRRP